MLLMFSRLKADSGHAGRSMCVHPHAKFSTGVVGIAAETGVLTDNCRLQVWATAETCRDANTDMETVHTCPPGPSLLLSWPHSLWG